MNEKVESRGRTILVVEDDAVYRDLLALGLGCEGYDIVTAENGARALNLVQESRPDAILLDLLMPVMDGLSFLRTIKEECSVPIPTLVLTCLEERSYAIEALVAGATDVLTKPVDLDDLLRRIETLLGDGAALEPALPPGAEDGKSR